MSLRVSAGWPKGPGLRLAGASLFVCCASMAAGSSVAEAFKCKVSDKYDFVSLRWPTREISFGVREGADADLSDIESAFGEWSEKACTDLSFDYVGIVSADAPVNQVVFVEEGWALGGRPSDAVAVTLTTYGRSTGVIRGATIEVNTDLYVFTDVTEGCDPQPPTYDLIAVLTHEVGHFIGLDHTEAFEGEPTDPTMAPLVGECEADKRSLEPDDVSALCLLYPRGEATGSCASLPTQANPYVESRAFGCSTSGPAPRGLLLLAMGTLALSLALAKRRGAERPSTCSGRRSEG